MRFRDKVLGSISSTINAIYVGIIILSVILISSMLYFVAERQIDQSTEDTMNNLINQKTEHLSDIYQDVFEQFYTLTKSLPAMNLLSQQSPSGESYLKLSEEVDEFYNRNHSLIDSIYISIHDDYEITVSEQQSLNNGEQINHIFHPKVPEREGYFWLNNHTDLVFDLNQEVQSIVYYEKSNSNSKVSTFLLNLKTSYIDSVLTQLPPDGSYMMILSPEGYYISKDAPSDGILNLCV